MGDGLDAGLPIGRAGSFPSTMNGYAMGGGGRCCPSRVLPYELRQNERVVSGQSQGSEVGLPPVVAQDGDVPPFVSQTVRYELKDAR